MTTTKGRFELSAENFKKFKDVEGKEFQVLDFKKLFPELFGSGDGIPDRLKVIWRKCADAYLTNEKGLYFFQEKGCVAHFSFDNFSGALAKTEIDTLGNYIKKNYQSSLEDGDAVESFKISAPPNNKPTQNEKTGGGDEDLQKVLEGLRKNPEISEVKLWSDRALRNLHLSVSIPQDMMKLRKEYKICYVPLWNAESGVIVGASCELNPRGTCADHDGQIIRDNIAIITAAREEIERLSKKGVQAILGIPVYTKTLLEKEISELVVTFLSKTPEGVRKSMIFELRGIGKGHIPNAAKEPLENISRMCRALIIDTGILSQPDLGNEPFSIHAYGCNFNDVNLPQEQKLSLMKKYSSAYKARGAKVYIRNIPNIELLEQAQKLGFAYVNAPSVIGPRLSCPPAARMLLENIKAL